jgi:cholesterol transport system auxiliary component
MAMLCVALSGCALAKLGADPPAPNTYDLMAPVIMAATKRSATQIIVSEPTAVRALSSDNILVKPSPAAVTYYANAVWSDTLPRLLQARLIQTLEGSGRFRAVGDGRERLEGDVELLTQIRAFQIDAFQVGGVAGARTASVDLFVKLVDQRSGRVLSSGSFAESVPVGSSETADGVAALNQAAELALPKIAAWAGKIAAR